VALSALPIGQHPAESTGPKIFGAQEVGHNPHNQRRRLKTWNAKRPGPLEPRDRGAWPPLQDLLPNGIKFTD
jgi:hypothetical protein